jgi:hypothetical protein
VTKDELKEKVATYGEAIITYRSSESNKLKYNVCTLDFSTPYVANKQNRAKETDNTLLVFCWDVDAYRLLKPANVTSVVALASALKEGKDGR